MIFVKKPRAVPNGFGKISRLELADITAHFGKKTARRAKFEFRAYRHQSVKDALEALFKGKCAYCEWRYGGGSYFEVDHYRPKKHYYWLAADWSNLLPACKRCNNGKLSAFPLLDPARQARRRGEERREKPLLLNPTDRRNRPEDHLRFDPKDGSVSAKVTAAGETSRFGAASIRVYKLARTGLSVDRKEWTLRVRNQIRRCVRAAETGTAQDREDEYQELKGLLKEGQPFRALTIAILRENGIGGR